MFYVFKFVIMITVFVVELRIKFNITESLFLCCLPWMLIVVIIIIIIIPIGCFPVSTVKRVGLICHSCVETSKSEDGSIRAVGKRVRYLFVLPLGLISICWELSEFGVPKVECTEDDSTRE